MGSGRTEAKSLGSPPSRDTECEIDNAFPKVGRERLLSAPQVQEAMGTSQMQVEKHLISAVSMHLEPEQFQPGAGEGDICPGNQDQGKRFSRETGVF